MSYPPYGSADPRNDYTSNFYARNAGGWPGAPPPAPGHVTPTPGHPSPLRLDSAPQIIEEVAPFSSTERASPAWAYPMMTSSPMAASPVNSALTYAGHYGYGMSSPLSMSPGLNRSPRPSENRGSTEYWSHSSSLAPNSSSPGAYPSTGSLQFLMSFDSHLPEDRQAQGSPLAPQYSFGLPTPAHHDNTYNWHSYIYPPTNSGVVPGITVSPASGSVEDSMQISADIAPHPTVPSPYLKSHSPTHTRSSQSPSPDPPGPAVQWTAPPNSPALGFLAPKSQPTARKKKANSIKKKPVVLTGVVPPPSPVAMAMFTDSPVLPGPPIVRSSSLPSTVSQPQPKRTHSLTNVHNTSMAPTKPLPAGLKSTARPLAEMPAPNTFSGSLPSKSTPIQRPVPHPAEIPRMEPRSVSFTFNPTLEARLRYNSSRVAYVPSAERFVDDRINSGNALEMKWAYNFTSHFTNSAVNSTPIPLTKPAVRPGLAVESTNFALFGTQEDLIGYASDGGWTSKSRLVLFHFDASGVRFGQASTGQLPPRITSLLVDDSVKDVHWNHPLQAMCAIGKRIAVVSMADASELSLTPAHINYLPEFHSDDIREIAVNFENRVILSGGHDGKVFLTDLVKLMADIRSNLPESGNSNYETLDTVGSVRWHPTMPTVASLTTDNGTFHAFDIRDHGPAIYHTGLKGLYSHCYRDANTIVLGYGTGNLGIIDLRYPVMYSLLKDPAMEEIGEVRFNPHTNTLAAFGSPKVTLWQCAQGISENTNATAGEAAGQTRLLSELNWGPTTTSGDFLPNSSCLMTTTGNGWVSMFDVRAS